MKENPYESDPTITDELRNGDKNETPGKEVMTFEEWLSYGTSRDWASVPICGTHDGFPDATDNRCQHYILLYTNKPAAEDSRRTFKPAVYRVHTRNHRWWNIDID